jgi:UDP-N-acetylmuramoyl-tripeptide--D-alanyl-D-alanine ligase
MKVSFFEKYCRVELSIKESDFSHVSTDTRSLKKGALFIALRGPNFNGNDFVDKAFEAGALCCVVDDPALKNKASNIIYVEDTKVFLQELAQAWVNHLNPYVIGITGSNGKTTTKFFTAQILSKFLSLHYSPKSFNNDIGLPLTQLGLSEENKVLICEIGTSGPGEIEALTKQAPADLCMVTTVGPSHLDKLKDLEGVFNEKKQIYLHSKKRSAIFNLDNPYTKKMFDLFKEDFESYLSVSTQNKNADVFINVKKESLRGLWVEGRIKDISFSTEIPVFGSYNVYNIMFAVASGVFLNLEIKGLIDSLKTVTTPWGRSQILKDKLNRTYVFDGYNSNLQSMTSLLDSLKNEKCEQIHLILGEMLELGEQSEMHHRELGKLAGSLRPKSITFLGEHGSSFLEGVKESKFEKNLTISSTYNKELALKVQSVLDEKDTVVLKASRGTKIEQFLMDMGVDIEPL